MTSSFQTVAEAIANVGNVAPERGFTFQDLKGAETFRSFKDIEVLTGRRAAALQELGLRKGDRMGLIVVEPEEFVLTFLAALRVGVLPVPLYPPLSMGSLDSYAERTMRVLNSCQAKVLVASAQLQNILWSLVDAVPSMKKLVPVEELANGTGTPVYPEIKPEDLAFLQYTSGSTADPKGVMVTHANLIANTHGIIEGLDCRGHKDVGVTWLPLYHDMGLIGFVLAPIVHAIPIVFIPTIRFIKRPSVWMETIHQHRGTMTFGPNFAYALVAKKMKESDLARWDLSCVKAFGCGAEPIHPDTVREFMGVYGRCGVPESAFLPAYGMAEATLAVCFKPLDQDWRTRVVDAERFQGDGVAAEPTSDDAVVLEHVSCGRAFPGYDVKIRAEDGRTLPEGVEGEICLRGPSICPGYYENPEATAAARDGEWLRTGDLGYLHDGQIYVTGRLKDLIILNGRNIHPQAVEWACASVEGVRKGNIVAFSVPGQTSEDLIVALETRAEDKATLIAAVKAAVQKEVGMAPADVVCLDPGTLPKTSSGKLQRRKTRQQYVAGELGAEGSRLAGSTGDKITLVRHVAKSMWTRAKASAPWR